ncbi:hypothetical protein CDAR_203601 [Caerostris darwini]|uniref:Uncharacterized protein n=1 Tax=Caerostris darwini TaxID=1538125 RepID=A0AAV4TWW6_9ARAC|nr:hypothetical protein CDAR_203601 [Caerostris darwini]
MGFPFFQLQTIMLTAKGHPFRTRKPFPVERFPRPPTQAEIKSETHHSSGTVNAFPLPAKRERSLSAIYQSISFSSSGSVEHGTRIKNYTCYRNSVMVEGR